MGRLAERRRSAEELLDGPQIRLQSGPHVQDVGFRDPQQVEPRHDGREAAKEFGVFLPDCTLMAVDDALGGLAFLLPLQAAIAAIARPECGNLVDFATDQTRGGPAWGPGEIEG